MKNDIDKKLNKMVEDVAAKVIPNPVKVEQPDRPIEKKEYAVSANSTQAVTTFNLNEVRDMAEIFANSSLTPNKTTTDDVISSIIVGQGLNIPASTSALMVNSFTPTKIAIALRGKEFGLNFHESQENFYLNEKTGNIAAHVSIGYISLKRAGVKFEILKDCEPLIKYRQVSGINKGVYYKKDELPKIHKITAVSDTPESLKQFRKDHPEIDVFVETIIDMETKIRFYDGVGLDQTLSYYRSDAEVGGLLEKSVWQKNLKTMMFARVLFRGARTFASFESKGLYSVDEMD